MNIAEIPNLDCLECSELGQFIDKMKLTKHPTQEERVLQAYALHKRIARGARLTGNINRAIQQEAICDRLYEMLPADCRW